MRLSELFEAGSKHVTFCFGRMNPPTMGHKEVFKTMASVGGDYKIFLSQTQDRKKNPLDYGTKINFVKTMFPEHAKNVVDDPSLNTIVKVASFLYDQGYTDATFVAGSDRLEDMKKLLENYNGVEGKAHGYYKFNILDFKSSGDREDGAEGVAGISAGNARAAAANNDFEKFEEAIGTGNHAKELFRAVREGMGIQEDIEEGWKSKAAGAALAAANLLGSPAQAAEEPVKPITIAYVMIDGEVKKYNLGDKFSNAKEAEKFISGVLDKQGLQGYTLEIKHGYPKKKDVSESELSELKIKPGQTTDELYKGWNLRYQIRPAEGSKEFKGRADHTKSKQTKSIGVLTGSSKEDIVQKLKDAIDSSRGTNQIPSTGKVTIFFNSTLARDVIGHGDEIYADIIVNNGNPVLLLSPEDQGGMYKATDRSPLHQRGQEGFIGQQAFIMPASEAIKNGLTLARYGLGKAEQEYMPGITAIPLEFRSEVYPGEVVRLNEPGLTVSPPRKGQTMGEGSYGKYWCSTDKKWKQRKGPKQSRKS